MARIDIYCAETNGRVKPMHAVNNGPVADRSYEKRGNFTDFAALGIPFVRNHDASLSEAYGAQHVVDVHCIFPNFDRDASDPDAYDFTLTDVYTARIIEAGSEVFYRLGSSIEHWAKKYGTLKPRDFKKWADICEHIMMHYLEGWANGFTYGIRYWEIWNEPDLDPDDAENKRTWGGTKLEFFDLYEVAAKQLKARFPQCMIGGPAVASSGAWPREFLTEMHRRGVPLDFFSWHIYSPSVERFHKTAGTMRQMLDECGYAGVPSILNEWNYVKDWSDLIGSTKVIKGLKGSSHAAAVMCSSQGNPDVDMLMY